MNQKKPTLLIISFFFAPDKRVGALRTSYWFRELPKASGYNVKVITANPDASGEDIIYVPQVKGASKWNPIKDDGLTWKVQVREYLSRNPIDFDVVIISGSPFLHFGLTSWLKTTFGCKVILDYRDPFAINPGFNNSKLKILLKKMYERSFNRSADALITVNKYCGEIISFFHKKPNAIIQNGYDETIEPTLKPVDLKNPVFCYTGKFYFEPSPIIKALEKLKLKMYYAGIDSDKVENSEEQVENYGLVSYSEAVDLTAKCDIAIIQTFGEDFQSTTKLFDYIRCKRVILIVSNRNIERGSLHEELKGYPNVFWAKNNTESIVRAIRLIQESTYTAPDEQFCGAYSRREQMFKLVKLIDLIVK